MWTSDPVAIRMISGISPDSQRTYAPRRTPAVGARFQVSPVSWSPGTNVLHVRDPLVTDAEGRFRHSLAFTALAHLFDIRELFRSNR